MIVGRNASLTFALFIAACSGGGGALQPGEGSNGTVPLADAEVDVPEPACPPPASDMCQGESPSYATEVVPILDQRCNNCHAENSDGGPWPLGGYADVTAWRDTIMNDLLRCTMPPADAGVPIPNRERAVLMAWIICGTPDN